MSRARPIAALFVFLGPKLEAFARRLKRTPQSRAQSRDLFAHIVYFHNLFFGDHTWGCQKKLVNLNFSMQPNSTTNIVEKSPKWPSCAKPQPWASESPSPGETPNATTSSSAPANSSGVFR